MVKELGWKSFGLGEKANDCVKKKRQRLSEKENAWVKKTKRVLQADQWENFGKFKDSSSLALFTDRAHVQVLNSENSEFLPVPFKK